MQANDHAQPFTVNRMALDAQDENGFRENHRNHPYVIHCNGSFVWIWNARAAMPAASRHEILPALSQGC